MNKSQEEKLRKEFEHGFKTQFKNGMAQGVYAVSKVIFDRASDESMSPEERISEIKRFCQVSLNVNKAGVSPADT